LFQFNIRLLLLLALFVFSKTEGYSFYAPKDSVAYYLSESKKHVYDDFTKAEFYLKKADVAAKKSKDSILIADVAHNFGASYYIIGSYDISLQKFIEALSIYENHDNKLGIAKCLMGQGLIQQAMSRNKEAIKLFESAVKLCVEIGDNKFASRNFINIGLSQVELKLHDEAYLNFHRALKLSIKSKNQDDTNIVVNKLGSIHFLRNDIDSAIYYYKKNILSVNNINLWEKSFAFTGLSEAYLKNKNYKLAEEYGLKGYQSAQKVQAKWDIVRASEILSNAYKEDKNFEEAYKYLEISKIYSDSLFNDSKLKQINLLELKSKDVKNEKLAALNQIAHQKLEYGRIFIASMILLLAFLLIILYQYKKNSKLKEKLYKELEAKNLDIKNRKALIIAQNKTLSDLNQTKNRLFSILSHDLKSPIASIQQVLELLKFGNISDEEMKIISEHLIMQVESTSRLLNNLLHWSITQLDGAKINRENFFLDEILKDSIGAMILMIDNKEIKIDHIHPEKEHAIRADIGHVRVILNNLLSNAVKFTPKLGVIEIKYSEETLFCNLHITNSGSEISKEKMDQILNFDKRISSEKGTGLEEGTGLGLLLVKQFVFENKGKLQILNHPEGGTEFIVSFQKAK